MFEDESYSPALSETGGEPGPDQGPSSELPGEARRLVDYTVKLSDEELEELGRAVREEIDHYREDVSPRLESCKRWRDDYEQVPVKATRWAGASELSSPFTRIYCDSHTTRLDTQLVQIDPPLSVIARKQAAIDAASAIEEAITAALEEAGWKEVAGQIHSELPVTGNVFLRLTYEEEWRRKPEVVTEWDPDVFKALAEAGVPPEQAFLQAIEVDGQGNPKIALEWRNELKDAGPRMKVIPWEDGVVLPVTVRDPKQARGIGERLMISGAELKAGVRQGKYLKDAVSKLLERPSDDLPEDRADRLEQQGIDPDANLEPADGHRDPAYRWYECYELAWKMDGNDDGWEEWVLLTIHYDSHTILRCTYLPYEHGEPPYTLMRYIVRPQELWGMGVAELVAALQDGHTAVLNQIIDSMDLALAKRGNFFYEPEHFNPSKFTWELNKPIPLGDISAVKEMQVTPLPPEALAMLQQLKDYADLLTATSNVSVGKATDTDKTAYEVSQVLAAGNMIFERIARQVALQWASVWDQFRWLLAQFGQDGQVEYRRAARPDQTIEVPNAQGQIEHVPAVEIQGQMMPAPQGYAFGTISAEMLRADVDLVPTGLKQMGDAQARLNQAMMALQMLQAHPLVAMNAPAQLILVDYFLQAIQFPQHDKLMQELYKGLMMQAMAAKAAADAAAGAGTVAGEEEAHQANNAEAAAAQEGQINQEAHQSSMAQQSAETQAAAGAQGAAGPPVVKGI